MIRRADITVYADGVTPRPGVYITVKAFDGVNAILTNDAGVAIANPLLSGIDGSFYYNVVDGVYTEEYRLSLLEGPRRVIALSTGDPTSATPGSSVVASEALAAGAYVNIYDNSGVPRARNAVASDPAKFVNGFVSSAVASGAVATVRFAGTNSFGAGAGATGEVYLSGTTPGAFTTTPPSTAGYIVQALGMGVPGVGILFLPQPWITL